jgi:hypothetical protein
MMAGCFFRGIVAVEISIARAGFFLRAFSGDRRIAGANITATIASAISETIAKMPTRDLLVREEWLTANRFPQIERLAPVIQQNIHKRFNLSSGYVRVFSPGQ